MTRLKNTGKRVRKHFMKRASDVKEAIENRQKSFKGRKILYLNTMFETGMHKDETVKNVIIGSPNYIKFLISTTNLYVADEVIETLRARENYAL